MIEIGSEGDRGKREGRQVGRECVEMEEGIREEEKR